MTFGECKALALKLVGEYSDGGNLMVNADMDKKVVQYFNAGQVMIMRYTVLLRLLDIRQHGFDSYGKYYRFTRPDNFKAARRIIADGVPNGRPEIVGEYLLVPKSVMDETEVCDLEYEAYPAPVPEDVRDNYRLELTDMANNALAYFIAYNLLILDPVNKPTELNEVLQIMLSSLSEESSSNYSSVTVVNAEPIDGWR